MIKVLVADDELLVLVGIKSMIDWAALDMEIVATAHNGAEALAAIDTKHPDIVLMDINMPIKNGLEVAKECRQKYGQLPAIVFLTSYEDFSFAKEAIQLQAIDYLVKITLTPDILTASMKKAQAFVKNCKGTSPQSVSDKSDLFIDRFFLRLFNKNFDSPLQVEQQSKELGIVFTGDQYTVVLCELVYKQDRELAKETLTKLYASTLQTCQETVSKYCPCIVTGLDPQHFAITCMTQTDQSQDIADIMSHMKEILFSYFSVDLLCTIGTTVSQIFDIALSYQSINGSGDTPTKHATEQEPIVYAADMQVANYKDHIIENVQDFIKTNITKRLSLNDIAQEFGFTPNYVSQLFAKSCKIGFVEYVTNEKITAAKRMIVQSPDIKIYELADRLGFESAFYFSTVFKKIEGCSPKEYKESVMKNNKQI
ncbi:MAG: response regulator [Treponema sp.]|nr:response regulator [Treponema sp.]